MPATFTITSIKQEVGVGDRLAPVPARDFTNYAPHAPAAPTRRPNRLDLRRCADGRPEPDRRAQPRQPRRHRARPRAGAVARRQATSIDTDRQQAPENQRCPTSAMACCSCSASSTRVVCADPHGARAGPRRRPIHAALTPRGGPLARTTSDRGDRRSPRRQRRLVIERDELAAWLRLRRDPGVGRDSRTQTACHLRLAAGGDFAASSERAARGRHGGARRGAIAIARRGRGAGGIDVAMADGGERTARCIVTLGDAHYPRALLRQRRPAAAAVRAGPVEVLNAPAVAIVGSRNPTPQGADNARAFASHLSRAGLWSSSRASRSASTVRRTRARWPAAPARSRWWAPAWIASTRRAIVSSRTRIADARR